MDIWRAAEVLNRRKWLILLSMVVAAVLAFGATRLTGSRWAATVRFIVPEASPLTSPGSNNAPKDSREERATLQAMYSAMITSREVLEPAYNKVREALPSGTRIFEEIEFEASGPRLFDLRVYNSSPDRAERIGNALAESFVQRNHAINTQQSEKVVRLLKEQLSELDEKRAKARKRYQAYSRRNRVLGTPDEETKVALGEIEASRTKQNQIREQLAAAQARTGHSRQRIAQLSAELGGPRPVLLGPKSGALSAQVDAIEAKIAALQTRYGSEYPELKEARSTRDEIKAQFAAAQATEAKAAAWDQKAAERAALQQQIDQIEPKVAELQAQAATIDATIASAETWVQRSRELGDPFGSLASEVAQLAGERNFLAARLNAANIALDQAQRQNPIVIMSSVGPLNPPVNVTAGKAKKLVVLAVMCALIGTSALVIALDSIDRRLKSVHEAELLLPARVLAAIPAAEGPVAYSMLARVAESHPQSLQAEAYRFLGLHLLSVGGPRVRSLMVLSAKAEQGTTTTIANLAITLAQAGHRVILVDANTRTPELHKAFEERNDFGFTDLLMDPTVSSFEKALRPTSVASLRVITSGTPPHNPWELFRSENLTAVSNRLRDMADYVLYDTPSGTLFTDALNLAPVVDAAFLCVRALETPTGAEKRLIEMIDQSGVNMLGAVLSHVPVAMVAGYENYQNYYAPALRSFTAQADADTAADALAGEDGVREPVGAASAEGPARRAGQNGSNGSNGGGSGYVLDQDVHKEM